jgi:hypothetical protein
MISTAHQQAANVSRHRSSFLYGAQRDEILTLNEIHDYGIENFGDPDFLSLYGMKPAAWYARGIRILGRTAIECTRDILAQRIGADVSRVVGQLSRTSASPIPVVDPFAGSCNTLYWVVKSVPRSTGIGFENNKKVYGLASSNLARLGASLRLEPWDESQGLAEVAKMQPEALIMIVSPPWGHALDPVWGLDLLATTPPVPDVISETRQLFPNTKLIFAIQTFENLVDPSLMKVRKLFDWSTLATYDFNARGKNSGLLIGTTGWRPLC